MKQILAVSLLFGLALSCPALNAATATSGAKPADDEEISLIDLVSQDKRGIARDMLDRVEKIRLIESVRVDSVDFFTKYMLSADVGDLLDRSALPPELADLEPVVVYRTQNGKELFWAQPSDRNLTLMTCKVLDDGTTLPPEPMGDSFSDGGGDSNYPFVMQDGSTVYFANNGANSIGGYDIFMTRRSPDGEVLQPQNIGMPFNSPYNDFMMVIDENRNLGWWASDREQIPGKVTIYIFEPSQMRENYDGDLDNIEEIALLSPSAVTPAGNLDKYIPAEVDKKTVTQDKYTDLGALGKLTNPKARDAARALTVFMNECERIRALLAVLRMRYAGGDKSVAADILKIEAEQLKWPRELKRQYNKILSLENN